MSVGELNGDAHLAPLDRLRYLGVNFCRNLRRGGTRLPIRRWNMPAAALKEQGLRGSSPLRVLSESFLREELPRLHRHEKVNVLDVGCGSGRLASLLAETGFSGHYTGVDVSDRFVVKAPSGGLLSTTFIAGDAHTADLGGPFDLVLSVSALEHIAGDTVLLARLDRLLAADGFQVHIVPAPAALLLYLWHGYRQYGAASLDDRFDSDGTRIFALGGIASWLVHFFWITLPEALLGMKPRRAFPGLYDGAARLALRLDPYLPRFPLGYAIISPRASSRTGDSAS